MLKTLIDLVQSEVDSGKIVGDIAQLHARDRWFTYPQFQQSARHAQKRLRQAGAPNAEIIQFPADGKTLFGTWRGGLAWDVKAATLTVLEPASLAGAVLCDYRKVPCSLVMWSGSTSKGGLDLEVLDAGSGAKESDYAGKDFRGKIALVNGRALMAKGLAVKHGAVGILADWSPQQQTHPDAVFWNNAFSDDPGGWPLTTDCSRIFGFTISRTVGLKLRQLLASGERLRVHAIADTRIYSGEFPVVTGSIPGSGSEEVLALSHAFEQGAKDNASGVACIIEALRILHALIGHKKLPRPRRGIRILVTNECFGTIGYVDRFPACKKNTVAAICLDETGIDQLAVPEVQALFVNPHSNASYLDSFVDEVAKAVWQRPTFNPYVMRPYSSSDNMIAHATIGIPAVWMGCHGKRITWHTTLDTPERMAPPQLAAAAVYTAVYLYFLANAGAREAAWLASVAAAAAKAHLEREQVAALSQMLSAPASQHSKIRRALARRLAYLTQIHAAALGSILRLANTAGTKSLISRHVRQIQTHAGALLAAFPARGPKKLQLAAALVSPFDTPMPPEAHRIRPSPVYSGPITYDTIPAAERQGRSDPRWGGPVNVALGWADGKRTLAQTVALAEHESNRPLPGLAEELLWLIPHGLIRANSAR